jgi:hypothetical protein
MERTRKLKRINYVEGKSYIWNQRHSALLKVGFSEDEAAWGANRGVKLGSSQVKTAMEHRRRSVWWMRRQGLTRAQAIQRCSEDLLGALQRQEVPGYNIFLEVSG